MIEELDSRALAGREPPKIYADRWWPLIQSHLPLRAPADETFYVSSLSRLPFDALYALEISLDPTKSPLPDLSCKLESEAHFRQVSARAGDGWWQRILRRKIASDENDFLDRIPSFWLEMDRARHRDRDSRICDPLMCLTLPPQLTAQDLSRGLSSLGMGSGAADQYRKIESCIDRLPEGMVLLYAFDLRARNSQAIRLETLGLPRCESPPTLWLERIGANVPTWFLEMEDRSGLGPRPHLSVDVAADGTIGDRVGLEISLRRQPGREPKWLEWVESWTALGWCDPERAQAVFSWLGQSSRQTEPELWPVLGVTGNDPADGYVARVLSHFKLVGAGASRPEIKAYLLFQFLPAGRNPAA